jgi:TPR repeat protein
MKTRIGQLYKDGPTALFLKVAPRGEKRFDWSVGECHERGEGGVKTPSMRDAQPHYRRGADAATPEEWHQLAKRCADGGHHADALRWYTKVARASTPGNVLPISVDAAYRVAMCHEKGTGVAANHETAVAWYRAAADGAHVEAASRLGILLFDKSKAYDEAVRWLEMAATRGDAVAGLKLGLAYATGKGVEKDPRAAAKARSISHWSPYDRVRVVNADP